MNTKEKLKLMKEVEKRNEQRRKEFREKRIFEAYIKGHITKERLEELLKK